MKNKIWVVEMWNEERRRWEPTVGAGLNREDIRVKKREWKRRNPNDRFRIYKYASGGEW